MTYNPLEQASIALSQVGQEARRHGMVDVQRGLDCLAARLDRQAADAEEQIEEGMLPHAVFASGLHEAVCPETPPLPGSFWALRLSAVLVAAGIMWAEGSTQSSPGVGFAVAMVLLLGAAVLP